jgi:hypothetical protein
MDNRYITPAQWEEQNGMKLPDDAPVWYIGATQFTGWKLKEWWRIRKARDYRHSLTGEVRYDVVVANARWGRPPADWRLE